MSWRSFFGLLINSKYTYLLSLEYIRATATKASTITWLDDYKFPDLRRSSRFTDRDTNLFKATSRVKREAKTAIRNIFAELNDSAKESGHRMVTALIIPTSLCPIGYINHRRIFDDYFRLHDLMNDLRSTLKSWHCLDLADSIESTQQGLSAFIHDHLLFSTGTNADNTATVGAVMNAIASRYGYTVKLKPLMNRHHAPVVISANSSYSGDNYQTVARFVQYIYKQYKLPIAYGSDDKARATYRRFKKLDTLGQKLFIEAIENSTKCMRLRHHVSYKRYLKHKAERNLAGIRFQMNKFNIIARPTLLNHSYISEPQEAHSISHHYTSNEQWLRATRIQMKMNAHIVKLGAEWLSHAINPNTYLFHQINKKATDSDSGGQNYTYTQIIIINRDMLIHSGIPP